MTDNTDDVIVQHQTAIKAQFIQSAEDLFRRCESPEQIDAAVWELNNADNPLNEEENQQLVDTLKEIYQEKYDEQVTRVIEKKQNQYEFMLRMGLTPNSILTDFKVLINEISRLNQELESIKEAKSEG